MTDLYGISHGHLTQDRSKKELRQVRVPCRDCNHATHHLVLSSIDTEAHNEEADFHVWEQFQIIQCQGCDLVSFREDYQSTEAFHIDEAGEQVLDHHERLYPPRAVGRATIEDSHLLPEPVHRIYKETHAALCSELLILATVGTRALIEAICNEKGTCGGGLAAKIDNLYRLGTLSVGEAELLHRIRSYGNVSAHELEPAEADVLSTAFSIVENLLQRVYIFANRLPEKGGDDDATST